MCSFAVWGPQLWMPAGRHVLKAASTNADEMRWDEMRWDEMRWDEMRWDEKRWEDVLQAASTSADERRCERNVWLRSARCGHCCSNPACGQQWNNIDISVCECVCVCAHARAPRNDAREWFAQGTESDCFQTRRRLCSTQFLSPWPYPTIYSKFA